MVQNHCAFDGRRGGNGGGSLELLSGESGNSSSLPDDAVCSAPAPESVACRDAGGDPSSSDARLSLSLFAIDCSVSDADDCKLSERRGGSTSGRATCDSDGVRT